MPLLLNLKIRGGLDLSGDFVGLLLPGGMALGLIIDLSSGSEGTVKDLGKVFADEDMLLLLRGLFSVSSK